MLRVRRNSMNTPQGAVCVGQEIGIREGHMLMMGITHQLTRKGHVTLTHMHKGKFLKTLIG